jgi:adenylate cyclase class 2
MNYEVEQKFPVADLAPVEARLAEMGVHVLEPQCEVDLYYAHPARDFARTDEALRIRRVGLSSFITYKGPKVDDTTKTRREIELPLAGEGDPAVGWQKLLDALGFAPVAQVRKHRRKGVIGWHGRRIVVSLDEVDELGRFVEIELAVPRDEMDRAKRRVASLAEELRLSASERRSYLELLLEHRAG